MRSTTRSLALLLSILSRPAVAAASLPPCPGGQFVVQGSSLVPGVMASGTDSVSFSSTLVGIQSGCAAVAGRVRATSRGARVKARWDTCDHVIGRAKLSAIVDAATCNTMTGTFKAPKMRVKIPFTAVRSVSGSCNDDTLRIIQTRIFNYRGCNVSTCHGAASGYPPAGNLDLRPGYAYASLVGVPANNPAAQAAGKLRVMAGDAGQSFLSQKLRGTQAADEGSRMPLIGLPLPQAEIDLIDAWIAAGAPEIGQVAGAPCLPPLQYQPSTAPAPPPGGYQITLDGPTLLPGQEQEGCFWMPVPNAIDFYASQFEFVLNPGTHHYSIFPYTFPGTPQLGVWRVNDFGCYSGAMFGNSLSGSP